MPVINTKTLTDLFNLQQQAQKISGVEFLPRGFQNINNVPRLVQTHCLSLPSSSLHQPLAHHHHYQTLPQTISAPTPRLAGASRLMKKPVAIETRVSCFGD